MVEIARLLVRLKEITDILKKISELHFAVTMYSLGGV